MVNVVHQFPAPHLPSSSRSNGRSPSIPNGHSSITSRHPLPNGHAVQNGHAPPKGHSPATPSSIGRYESHDSEMDGGVDDWDSEGEDGMETVEQKIVVHSQSWPFDEGPDLMSGCRVVEVSQHNSSILQPGSIEQNVRGAIQSCLNQMQIGSEFNRSYWEDSSILGRHVQRIWIADSRTFPFQIIPDVEQSGFLS